VPYRDAGSMTSSHFLTESAAPPPRWALWAAHIAALTPLPSGLWRLGLAAGFPLGYTETGLEDLIPPGIGGPAYLVALSLLTEGAALLTLGLVQPWGERTVACISRSIGRHIPRGLVAVPAWCGVAALTALWTPMLLWWSIPTPT
jgi:hypothetical protein